MKAKNIKTVNSSPLPFYIFCLHEKKIQKAVFSNSAIVPVGATYPYAYVPKPAFFSLYFSLKEMDKSSS